MPSTMSLRGDIVGYLASSQTNLREIFKNKIFFCLLSKKQPKIKILKKKVKALLPCEVGIYRNAVNSQRSTFPTDNPLNLLDLASDFVRNTLNEAI